MDDFTETKDQLKEIGANLRRARDSRNITQQVLADRADLDIRTLQRIEAGQMNASITIVIRLKNALKCPWQELFP